MKFVCLGYIDEKKWEAIPEAEVNAGMDECFEYDDLLRKEGRFVGGEGLQPSRNTVTLRYDEGKVSASKGPFLDTREQLGGILILEAKDMDEAVRLLSNHPGIKFGPFEIRPVEDMAPLLLASEERRRIAVS